MVVKSELLWLEWTIALHVAPPPGSVLEVGWTTDRCNGTINLRDALVARHRSKHVDDLPAQPDRLTEKGLWPDIEEHFVW